VTAAAWLGVLRAHQSRTDEALALLRPAARGQIGVEHTSATCTRCCSPGTRTRWPAARRRPWRAFTRYTAEVERRQVPRFAGRAVNFAGWVLRNLGAWPEALDHHLRGAGGGPAARAPGDPIAALQDLAEQAWRPGTRTARQARLAQAAALLQGDLVFGWRLELKHQLLTGRLALLRGDAERRWPRPPSWRPGGRAGRAPVRQRRPPARAPGEPGAGPARGPGRGGPRTWTCSTAAWPSRPGGGPATWPPTSPIPAWLDAPPTGPSRLARQAGRYADGLRREADQRLSTACDSWRLEPRQTG
jgi:hypothetical protein